MRVPAALLAAASLVAATHAADGELRAYAVPGHGKIEMVVPADWYDEPRQAPGGLPTVRFFDQLGERPAFDMSLTIAWSVGKEPSFTDPARLRAFVSQSAEEVTAAATERRVIVRELGGTDGAGYYFQATLKEQPAGRPPHLTQGALVVGKLLLTFSILTADPRAPFAEQALTILRSARHLP